MMAQALVPSPAYFPAPLAAPVIPEYPQFAPVPVPRSSNAPRAWEGVIQPFIDDATAREFLRRVESNSPFEIERGSIFCQSGSTTPHRADARLIDMQIRFRVIVLDFDDKEHPRAYARHPEISRAAHPLHPHLRENKPIFVGRRTLDTLCIYSGAAFTYLDGLPRIVQFLDQLAGYLGRHAIWLRTRVELPLKPGETVRVPDPSEIIYEVDPRTQRDPRFATRPKRTPFWRGYWPGLSAPSGAEAHLRTIRPSQQCWCCSGQSYGQCHRPVEQRAARDATAR
jgi:hypothetical protein